MSLFHTHLSGGRVSAGRILAACSLLALSACGGAPTVGPDALKPEFFSLSLADGQSLPKFAYALQFGGMAWIESARLKSVDAGRTVDPRIFDDRSGNGSSGGGSRDSTTASARMADIRVFQDRTANSAIVGRRTDTTNVTVERRGDLLLIKRDHPDPNRAVVDTGRFENGVLVVNVREWSINLLPKVKVQFVYSISK